MTLTVLLLVAAGLIWARRRARRNAPLTLPGARRRGRFGALVAVVAILGLQAVVGSPAAAQQADTSCSPYPERPGAGMVGAIDPSDTHGLMGGPYTSDVNDSSSPYHDPDYPDYSKYPNSPYLDHGYAGMVWHAYDPNCQQTLSITSPNTTIDTWLGNELFDVGKNIVGATNSLHYTLYTAKDDGGLLGGLTNQISEAASSIFDNIYGQLFSVAMLVLAVLLFRQIWRGDLASVSKRALFALAGMWLAASSLVIVGNYAAIDRFIIETTTGIQNGFQVPTDDRVQRHVLPTELHTRVVYENWLRGSFGAPDDPKAKEYGRALLAAQAWKWEDLPTLQDGSNEAEAAKRAEFQAIYSDLGPAQGYFTGRDGSRAGAGFLSMFQGVVYSFFQFLAKLAVLLAQALLRIFTLAAPVIGLVALIHHDVLRKVGRAVGAVVLNLLVLAVLAGIHFRFLEMIFGQDVNLSMLTQMLLAGIVTLVFLLVGRPFKRMWQMVELSVNATGASMPSGGLFSKFRRRKGDDRGPQDEFWDQLRDSETAEDTVAAGRGGLRPRPEATGPVMATAERLDTRRAVGGGGALALSGSGGRRADGDPALLPSGGGGRIGPTGALLSERTSRLVDTAPVSDRGWDWGEDAVVVPSQVPNRRGEAARFESAPAAPPRQVPRPADVEMVAGRPVHVVYRPSRGLEVREPAPRRMPLRDGPRETDSVVR
jgi:hypothetical protein